MSMRTMTEYRVSPTPMPTGARVIGPANVAAWQL